MRILPKTTFIRPYDSQRFPKTSPFKRIMEKQLLRVLPSGQDWNSMNPLDVLRVWGSVAQIQMVLGSELLQGHGPGGLGRLLRSVDLLQPITPHLSLESGFCSLHPGSSHLFPRGHHHDPPSAPPPQTDSSSSSESSMASNWGPEKLQRARSEELWLLLRS